MVSFFFQERIDIAKYCSQEQIYMFSHMLQRTLDISVGRKRQGRHGNRDKVLPTMSRHITTVGKIRKIVKSSGILILKKIPSEIEPPLKLYGNLTDMEIGIKSCPL